MEPDRKRADIVRMSEDELRQFAIDFAHGKIFSSAHIRNLEDLPVVFIPLGFSNLCDHYTEEAVGQIGLIYEHMSKALPRGINGMPMFASACVMHRDDWERALVAIRKYRDMSNEPEV